jgi:DNA-binding transcriptional ArsR family regulator/mRNA-degrading endonuclease RelE of RelBE toxin-antitoxin system
MATTEGQQGQQSSTDQGHGGDDRSTREAANIFKIVSVPIRLHILRLLAMGERTVSQLSSLMDRDDPTVSHHLELLRTSGLIASHRQGKQTHYSLTELSYPLLHVIGTLGHVGTKSQALDESSVRVGETDLVFQSTKEFEADMDRLTASDRARVAAAINDRSRLILTDRQAFEADLSRPYNHRLSKGLESTLSVMRIEGNYRVILTVDDDPLFGRIIVTLIRLVEKNSEDAAYRAAASMLYEGI